MANWTGVRTFPHTRAGLVLSSVEAHLHDPALIGVRATSTRERGIGHDHRAVINQLRDARNPGRNPAWFGTRAGAALGRPAPADLPAVRKRALGRERRLAAWGGRDVLDGRRPHTARLVHARHIDAGALYHDRVQRQRGTSRLSRSTGSGARQPRRGDIALRLPRLR